VGNELRYSCDLADEIREKATKNSVPAGAPHIPQCGIIVKENLEMSFKNRAVL
jgi:hypothetical protein